MKIGKMLMLREQVDVGIDRIFIEIPASMLFIIATNALANGIDLLKPPADGMLQA